MTITAKVIADSIGPFSPRITTLQLRYPRFIHAEFMTHRVFSRNASSSRAIPVEKQIEMIREDTAMPSHWGKNQSGMQADEESDAGVIIVPEVEPYGNAVYGTAQQAWEQARDRAIVIAERFVEAGYHKQIVNRILEPYSHISVVVTATDFDNFFHLRRHKDAQPEIKILADAMFDAMEASTPTKLAVHDWHLPYVTDEERAKYDIGDQIKMSVARSARVSYLTHDGVSPDVIKDMALYDRLVGSVPLHASPAEHQAKADTVIYDMSGLKTFERPDLHGNFTGYIQYRKTLADENVSSWSGLNDFDE